MMKSIPPMNELFRQAGMELPEFLGKDLTGEEHPVCEEHAEHREMAAETLTSDAPAAEEAAGSTDADEA